jgi:poly(3-hydroxybutyrate) depolymerase
VTAAPGATVWPRISVWHGTHDQTVKPANATQIVDRWSGVHGNGDTPDKVESNESYTRKAWLNKDGSPALELYLVTGMGHGVPLPAGAKIPLGSSGPFMLMTAMG